MRFTKDGQEYRVFFKHFRPEVGIGASSFCAVESAHFDGLLPEEHYEGLGRQNPSDNFCRETGRCVSLGRALTATGWDVGTQLDVWEAYFLRSEKYIDFVIGIAAARIKGPSNAARYLRFLNTRYLSAQLDK